MSLRSMTGYACTHVRTELCEALIVVRTLNHRSLDIALHLPAAVETLEAQIRDSVRGVVHRGRVDLRLTFERAEFASAVRLDEARLDAYVKAFGLVASRYGVAANLDPHEALRFPGVVLEQAPGALPDEVRRAVLTGVSEALEQLDAFRQREGAELARLIQESNQRVAEAVDQIERLRSVALPWLQERLHQRLTEAIGSTSVDSQRLAQEVALLVSRSDVQEEVERLRIHSSQLRDLLSSGSAGGKNLDFLLQEMMREANTILSKTAGLGGPGLNITDLGIRIKTEVERMREQTFNLE
jgi:uncharacterized protein (TIGR00255 family)